MPDPTPAARVPTGRRGFFRSTLGELAARFDAWCGVPQYRRGDLRSLTDEQLAPLRPSICPDVAIEVNDDAVWAACDGRSPVRLFARTEDNNRLFNRFDGRHTLAEIAAAVARESDGAHTWEHVRAMFFDLVDKGVCAPATPIAPAGEPVAAPPSRR